MGSHWDPIMCWGPIVSSLHEGPCSALWGPIVSLLRYGVPLGSHCVPVAVWGPIANPFIMCWGSIVSPLHGGPYRAQQVPIVPHCVSVVLWGPIVYPLHSDVPLCLYWDPIALWGSIVSPLQRDLYSPTVHYGVLLCPCCTMGSHCESIHYMLQSHCEPTALWGPIMSLCPHCITWSPYVPIALRGPVVSLLGSLCTMRSRGVPIALWGPHYVSVPIVHEGSHPMGFSHVPIALWGPIVSPLHEGPYSAQQGPHCGPAALWGGLCVP